tara:strand:- start:4930 stop:8004 length:3075 start_codon:yes stop_codon:yes gene_type:complete
MKNKLVIMIIVVGLLFGQTSDQLKQVKDVIKSTGMSESQANDIVKGQGYTDQNIKAAVNKENRGKIGVTKSGSEVKGVVTVPDAEESNVVRDGEPVLEAKSPIGDDQLPIIGEEGLEVIDEKDLKLDSEAQAGGQPLTYFGYDIFKGDPALFQATSVGAVDPDYLIGPGDEIIVMLWGETQFRQVLTVDREGFVFIPEIGQVFVNGLNLNLLESKLYRVLSQSYASLNPQSRKPTTFLDVSLGNLRPLRIQVIGEVAQPGAYTVSPSATLFSALYYFNGPTTLGSLRDIRLIRGGKEIASIDFYDYLLTGKKLRDQKLQLDDVIFIPKRLKTVSIDGEINRPGIFELNPEEKLVDLIAMAGELKITAYLDRAQIDRIVPFDKRAVLGMDRMFTDVSLEEILKTKKAFPLQDGDNIQVFSVLDLRKNVVEIRGAVTRPGSYDLGEALRLSELIANADGLLGDAYLDRVDVVRIKPDFTEQLIKLNLKKALEKDLSNDIELQGLDRIRIYSMTEMVPRTYVSINGHVKRPGRYLLQENMSLYDLLFKAGGFVDEEFKKRTYLKRAELVRVKENSDEKEIIPFNLGLVFVKQGLANTNLRTDDAVRVYSVNEIEGETRYISITGNVKLPGRYELFEENMKVHDLLFKAGGFDDPQRKATVFLERADLIRYDENRITQTIIPFHLGQVLANERSKQNFKLQSGDEIRVYSQRVFNNVRSVSIDGVVRSPGTYTLKTGMTVKDLILEADGVSEDVYRYKIEVARIDPNKLDDKTYAEIIDLDMYSDYTISNIQYSFDRNPGSVFVQRTDFELQPYDYISVRPDPYFRMQRKITIIGAVYFPGIYVLTRPDEAITDILNRAGGLRPKAYAAATTLTRNNQKIRIALDEIIKNPNNTSANVVVQDGDEIFVALKPDMVQLEGEVASPGIYKFIAKQKVSDYIKMAGGYTVDAEKKEIWITYPNGQSKHFVGLFQAVKNLTWISNPKVMDGSLIIINRKKEEEPFNPTEFATELASILSDFTQMLVMISVIK